MAIADNIEALERKIAKLKVDYEQYFVGSQKRAPEKLRTEIEKLIKAYTSQTITNTAVNFRLNSAVAKFNSYRTYWDRTIREIEEGRYVKDVFRMRLHEKMNGAEPASSKSMKVVEKAPSPEEGRIKRIYQEFVEARKRTNEPIPRFETVADLINRQTPVIMEKYKASSVDFKVAIEGGKAKLKAVPKK